jgi:hypothetical protein
MSMSFIPELFIGAPFPTTSATKHRNSTRATFLEPIGCGEGNKMPCCRIVAIPSSTANVKTRSKRATAADLMVLFDFFVSATSPKRKHIICALNFSGPPPSHTRADKSAVAPLSPECAEAAIGNGFKPIRTEFATPLHYATKCSTVTRYGTFV